MVLSSLRLRLPLWSCASSFTILSISHFLTSIHREEHAQMHTSAKTCPTSPETTDGDTDGSEWPEYRRNCTASGAHLWCP